MKAPLFSFIEVLESRIAPAALVVTTLKDVTDANHDTGSLRDAIFQANAAVGPDTIEFQTTVHSKTKPLVGTIKLTSDLPTITDDLTITGPVSGKPTGIVINGNGHAAIRTETGTGGFTMTDLTVTHAAGINGGGLYLYGSGTFALTDVTVSKNRAFSLTSATSYGGGIYVENGTTVTISHSKITGNVCAGTPGGATTGASSAYGGGIFNRGNLTVSDSQVSGNIAQGGNAKNGSTNRSGGGGYGGGIYCSRGDAADAILIVQNSTISGNKVIGGNAGVAAKGATGTAGQDGGAGGYASGGGIYSYNGQVTVMGAVISGNSAKGGKGGAGGAGGSGADGGDGGKGGNAIGGGIAGNGTIGNPQLAIETSTISGNTIVAGKAGAAGAAGSHGAKGKSGDLGYGYGGGVFSAATVTITQSTISKNKGEFGGGIASLGNGTTTIINSTIAQNSAEGGGGIEVQNGSTVKIHNDTIAQNKASDTGGGIESFSPDSIEVISTIIAGNTAHTDADASGMFDASFDLIGKVTDGTTFTADTSNLKNENPLLGSLGLHGGTTATLLPSIKPGKLSPVIDAGSDPDLQSVDQRGDPRLLGDGVDIGAVEVK